mmetsp:Transcript_4213/g.15127  ORF Transcript_4213/g.15127 Transcript_4213/m.15127 type:complete len:236 (-) Transcript_4213:121-828(-)
MHLRKDSESAFHCSTACGRTVAPELVLVLNLMAATTDLRERTKPSKTPLSANNCRLCAERHSMTVQCINSKANCWSYSGSWSSSSDVSHASCPVARSKRRPFTCSAMLRTTASGWPTRQPKVLSNSCAVGDQASKVETNCFKKASSAWFLLGAPGAGLEMLSCHISHRVDNSCSPGFARSHFTDTLATELSDDPDWSSSVVCSRPRSRPPALRSCFHMVYGRPWGRPLKDLGLHG